MYAIRSYYVIFGSVQSRWFVQDFVGDVDLAYVKQQGARAQHIELVPIETEMPSHAQSQHADTHSVRGGILVFLSQLCNPGQGIGIADGAINNFRN